jgi:hypothetical protein
VRGSSLGCDLVEKKLQPRGEIAVGGARHLQVARTGGSFLERLRDRLEVVVDPAQNRVEASIRACSAPRGDDRDDDEGERRQRGHGCDGRLRERSSGRVGQSWRQAWVCYHAAASLAGTACPPAVL